MQQLLARSAPQHALRSLGLLLLTGFSSCIVAVDIDDDMDDGTRYRSSNRTRGHSESTAEGLRQGNQVVSTGVGTDGGLRPVDPSAPTFSYESFTLPNGLEVVLHQDRALPKVVVNTWFQVGSKDEEQGRTGFAHLFEHLMFMGTGRVPDNQFDVIMETGGGWNNATTSNDRTNYFSEGPSSLLPTLLWLDADRFEALDDHMTQAKLDSQRAVVRNERRQTSENVPYGKASLELPALMYPIGHPYHHPVIGSHEDLEAATVEDVVTFFRRWYVPANAKLVVAGDFELEETRALIEDLYGAIPARSAPPRTTAPGARLNGELRTTLTDDVEFPKLFLAWSSPAHYAPGDGEMDLVAALLTGGSSSRLVKHLVLDTGLAQEVSAGQYSGKLGSMFEIEALPSSGVDLDELKRELLGVVADFVREGPTPEELARVKAQIEADFLRGAENLGRRADAMNSYLNAFGTPDGFGIDLARWTMPTERDVADWAGRVIAPDHIDLRVLPEDAAPPNPLDARPSPFAQPSYDAPVPESFQLSNGITVHVLPRPGTGLFAGYAWFEGGESLVDPAQAGLSGLVARMLEAGAGGEDAATFAANVESLGAQLDASADNGGMFVAVNGLGSRLEDTLDRFADVIRRPNLTADDFEREHRLQLAEIAARADDPRALSTLTGMGQVFGENDARGRSTDGFEETVSGLALDDVVQGYGKLLHPGNVTLMFAGDLDVTRLRAALQTRFGDVDPIEPGPEVDSPPVTAAGKTGITIVDRAGAPQTMIYMVRPVPNVEGQARAVREALLTVLGGTFTSRLNANLREDKNYSYGAGAASTMRAFQEVLLARTAVFTDVTGAALSELKKEYDLLASGGIKPEELTKAIESRRTDLVETGATTSALARTLLDLVSERRPLDAVSQDLAALEGVTLETCNSMAASGLFDWSTYAIVLVGDRSVIEPQLAEAGF